MKHMKCIVKLSTLSVSILIVSIITLTGCQTTTGKSYTPVQSRAKSKQTLNKNPAKAIKASKLEHRALALRWPVVGPIVRRFGPKSNGLDIAGQPGTHIRAVESGKVVYSGNGLKGYGNLIIIKHNEKYLSVYAHNRELLVKEGTELKKGSVIAKMGNTESQRVKLHFQIRYLGKPIDPLLLLPKEPN